MAIRASQVSLHVLLSLVELRPPITAAADGLLSFDGECGIEGGESAWQLSVVLPDGSIATRPLLSTGEGLTVLTWATPLPAVPLPGAVWLLSAETIAPTLWRVLSITEDDLPAVSVTAVAHDPNKYTRVEGGLRLDAPPPTRTGPLEPPSNIDTVESLYQAPTGIEARADISWSPSPDPRVEMYEVQILAALDGTAWKPLSMTTSVTASAHQVAKGQYSIRVRSVSQFWPPSEWVTVDFQLEGLFAPPADVQNLWNNILSETILLGWDAVPDIDVDYYQIRYQPPDQPVAWDQAMVAVERVPASSTRIQLPAITGTYLIKAIDLSGIASLHAASTVVLVGELPNVRYISDLTEQDPWPGVLENIEVGADGDLRLVKVGGAYVSEGWYYFAAGTIDYGDLVTVRLTPNLDARGEMPDLTIQAWWDRSSVAGGTAGLLAAADVRLEVAVSNDNVAWSVWTPLATGDFEAQYFKYRVHLRTLLPSSVTPALHVANINTVGTDRVERGDGVLVPAIGRRIDYSIGFFDLPSIQITGQNVGPNDNYTITGQDEFGFNIQWKNNAGAGIAVTMDWLASGFGKRKAA